MEDPESRDGTQFSHMLGKSFSRCYDSSPIPQGSNPSSYGLRGMSQMSFSLGAPVSSPALQESWQASGAENQGRPHKAAKFFQPGPGSQLLESFFFFYY